MAQRIEQLTGQGLDLAAGLLLLVEALDLDGYQAFHAACVDLVRRLGRLSRTTAAAQAHDGWRNTLTPTPRGRTCTAPAMPCAGPADGVFRLVRACGR
ncbi:hypothetical protein [Streptomyces sp. RKAG293]|uniref:hypothetical protein n=1 Tax=Streptomyces sp. RKAG293 TaxID=2893403 RepID=UPI0020332BE2|nr:hypothetical protein [Streptomyces sp. RKAG293]MCM2422828.1 hypothetical protein [Streptomyces sp. RKAG293]